MGGFSEKSYENEVLDIKDNVLTFSDCAIQLSNVSQIKVSPIPHKKYPPTAFLCGIIGLLCFYFDEDIMKAAGVFLIGICAIWIFMIYNYNTSNVKFLIIELNSGTQLYFSSHNVTFLEEACKALTNSFKNEKSTYKINFEKCTVNYPNIGGTTNNVDGDMIEANYSTITKGDNNETYNEITANDWDELLLFLKCIINDNSKNTIPNHLSCKAAFYAHNKDKNGLTEFIKNNKDSFFNNVLSGVASQAILSIITRITGISF